jgi:hypothetical protein
MSALSGYVIQTQRLLHDAAAQFVSIAEIQDYVNAARTRVVRDTGCYRLLQTLYLSTGVEVYPFGGLSGFQITSPGAGYVTAPAVTIAGPGVTGGVTATAVATVTGGAVTDIVVTNPGTLYASTPAVSFTGPGTGAAATAYFINSSTIDCVNLSVYSGNSRIVLAYRDWSTFNALARSWAGNVGRPVVFSIYGYTQTYIARIPDQAYKADFDSVQQPPPLVDNTSLEVIPIVMQDPVQYFAAHLAKIKAQKWSEAEMFYQRYNNEIIKAINSAYTRRLKHPYAVS